MGIHARYHNQSSPLLLLACASSRILFGEIYTETGLSRDEIPNESGDTHFPRPTDMPLVYKYQRLVDRDHFAGRIC